MKTNFVVEKLNLLRAYMHAAKLDAFIIPSNDPHFSEYVADCWKCREWISGFNGSAGTVAVTAKRAALWTDSRYFLQAVEQLKGSGIELKKMGLPQTENIETWLAQNLAAKAKIGVDEKLFSVEDFEILQKNIAPLQLVATADPFAKIWKNRPPMPANKAFLLSEKYSGESVKSKAKRVAEMLNLTENKFYLISALDQIAWLFNLRGSDIDFNPTAIAYAAINSEKLFLFINKEKISTKDKLKLAKENVEIRDYETVDNFLKKLGSENVVVINSNQTNYAIYKSIKSGKASVEKESDRNGFISTLKAVKNQTELNGFRRAMIYDGVALVKFYCWLEQNLGKTKITELGASQKLRSFRAQCSEYFCDSFETIVGYAAHGAIVHYEPTPQTDVEIKPKGFLLIDSGGQYFCGTTDITRTIFLGKPSATEKNDYTLVLKGNIALSMAKFPAGTRGTQLDMLARQPLCSQGKNFMHGTGHGVGHFLNVHEGPQSIRMNENPVTLKVGMITSNEPGVYVTGKYGIRTENLIVCVPYKTTDFGEFFQFKTVTLCPIDTTAIDKKILSTAEISWLNEYHKTVYKKLAPYLSTNEKRWLQKKTQEI